MIYTVTGTYIAPRLIKRIKVYLTPTHGILKAPSFVIFQPKPIFFPRLQIVWRKCVQCWGPALPSRPSRLASRPRLRSIEKSREDSARYRYLLYITNFCDCKISLSPVADQNLTAADPDLIFFFVIITNIKRQGCGSACSYPHARSLSILSFKMFGLMEILVKSTLG